MHGRILRLEGHSSLWLTANTKTANGSASRFLAGRKRGHGAGGIVADIAEDFNRSGRGKSRPFSYAIGRAATGEVKSRMY